MLLRDKLLRSLCYCRDQAPSRPACRLYSWSLAQRNFQSNTPFSFSEEGLFLLRSSTRRSPLGQGGLEILVQVTAKMDLTERNKAILEKYKQIVVSNYKEPGIDGHFDDCTKEVLKGFEDDDSDTDEEVQSNTDSEI